MKILLESIGKKYKRDWIVRNFSEELTLNNHTVILGPNGSGKSTLLQLISGYLSPTEGVVSYFNSEGEIERTAIPNYLSYSSPYLEIHERLTLNETVAFHQQLKGFINGISQEEIVQILNLRGQEDKLIGSFSSGVKMRIKNALAILSDNRIVCLDEPLSNIDSKGRDWYLDLVNKHIQDRLFIVCSNEVKSEYSFCEKVIHTSDIR